MCDRPNVTISILPFALGAHPATAGPLSIMRIHARKQRIRTLDIFSDAGRKCTGIGTAKDEFIYALNSFWIDCGRPGCRPLARISETICREIVLPEETRFRVPAISKTTVSDTLAGRRKRFPAFPPAASLVLSCQRYAITSRQGRRDQGAAIVPCWAAICARHAEGQKPARQLPPGIAALASTIEFALTASQRGFLSSHGPHGKLLTARAELGHPRDRYRAALLLGTANNRLDKAVSLLLDVASTGYAPALDLLETLRIREHEPHGIPTTLVLGRLAHQISGQAWLAGAQDESYAFLIAAARSGVPGALLELARFRFAAPPSPSGGTP